MSVVLKPCDSGNHLLTVMLKILGAPKSNKQLSAQLSKDIRATSM